MPKAEAKDHTQTERLRLGQRQSKETSIALKEPGRITEAYTEHGDNGIAVKAHGKLRGADSLAMGGPLRECRDCTVIRK